MLYFIINENNIFKNELAQYIKQFETDYECIVSQSVLKDTLKVAKIISKNPETHRAVVVDEDGIGPFMVAAKVKNVICAQLNDEQSALMTRDHNNTNVISIGSGIVGIDVMKGIIKRFLTHDYAGGRHQVRIDMLNSMIEENNNV